MRFAIVISRYNEEITSGLLRGALEYFEQKGIKIDQADRFDAPGAFEIPLIAQQLAKLGHYTGIVCLGCIIKGDTAHFEFISLGATIGLMSSMLQTETPISFGILTTYNDEQALSRIQSDPHNKGQEAAAACFESAESLRRILDLSKALSKK
jgi:6,7-dimethyl-8-ribityllumazine synthase